MALLQPIFPQSSSTFAISRPQFSILGSRPAVICCRASHQTAVVNDKPDGGVVDRIEIRIGLPSKGRMAKDTLDLLKDCQLNVRQVNPRQYVAQIPQLTNVEVWFQRPKDIVRKLLSGDLDLGIVGLDIVAASVSANVVVDGNTVNLGLWDTADAKSRAIEADNCVLFRQWAKPETVEKVCGIVKKQLALNDDAVLTGESKFAALGADSLDTAEIVIGLEEEFGISVEEEGAQSIATVQDAADLIEDLIAKKA